MDRIEDDGYDRTAWITAPDCEDIDVLAWMPLPEPYKGGDGVRIASTDMSQVTRQIITFAILWMRSTKIPDIATTENGGKNERDMEASYWF